MALSLVRRGIVWFHLIAIGFMVSAPAVETPRYTGDTTLLERHDGGLRWAVGVQEHALFRPSRTQAAGVDEHGHHTLHGHTFHHAHMLAFWQGRFWVQWHGGPSGVEEGTQPAVPVYLAHSSNGRDWSNAQIVFPCVKTGAAQDAPQQQHYTPATDLRGQWEFVPDPKLPNVLILGDSISIAYTLDVRQTRQAGRGAHFQCPRNALSQSIRKTP